MTGQNSNDKLRNSYYLPGEEGHKRIVNTIALTVLEQY
jgi:hypothetical protein